jgi:hypothetical protein
MYAQYSFIATIDATIDTIIDIQPSQSPLLSPSPEPLLADAPPPTSMPLPPEAIYSSKEELYTAIQSFVAQHHYAFTIRRSRKINNSPRTKIIYNCDRYGLLLSENHPQKHLQPCQRQTTTRKTNCQFSVVAIQCISTE